MAAASSSDPEGLTAADWLQQIKAAEKRNQRWEERCKKIIRRYRNDHFDDDANGAGSGKGPNQRGMNVLWSNVETLLPSIYGREPVPIAERRFLDKDVTGRVASQVLERAMRYEMGDSGFHATAEQAVKDYLLVGRGVAWLRFKPVIGLDTSLADRGDDDVSDEYGDPDGDVIDPGVEADNRDGDQPTDESPREKLLSAGVEVDYIHWTDFLTSRARFWKELEWGARRVYMSRDDCVAEFGDEIGRLIPLEMVPDKNELGRSGRQIDQSSEAMKKAIVFEIWHKPTRKVYFVAKEFDKYLRNPEHDPLNLDDFWPFPKPLFATMTNDTLEPVPDYLEYQDQALQIDELTNRISLLTKALKVAGVYDSANKNLARLLDEGNENKLIPVPNWSSLSEKGGLASAVSFVPIKEIAETLTGLVEAREKVKQDMFEITGLADVIRGQADPRETAEAVQTKGRWGSLRLQARQMSVARFCRDIIRMMGEIIAEHYPPELLVNVSGAMYDEGIGEPAPEPPAKPAMPNGQQRLPGSPGGGVIPVRSPLGLPPPGMAPGGPSPPNVAPIPGGGGPGNAIAPTGMMAGGPPQPPQIPPALQYAMAMHQYQIASAQHKQEKLELILRAVGLLKQDKMRGFRIDIETDSTVQNDANEEKASRIAFIEATTKFVEQAFQIGAEVPDAAPMLGKMLLFGVRGFRAGRDLESSIEEFVDKMEKDAAARKDQPKPPSPEAQKAQAELQATQAKSAAEIQRAQIDAQSSAQDNQRAIEQKHLDQQLAAERMQIDVAKMRAELAMKEREFQMKMQEMRMQMELAASDHANKLAVSEREHGQKREQMDAAHSHALALIKAKPKEKAA